MSNNLKDLIFDLEVYMEIVFRYDGKKYSVSYDEDFAYLFDANNELARVDLSESDKLIDKKAIEGLSIKDIWNKVEIINM